MKKIILLYIFLISGVFYLTSCLNTKYSVNNYSNDGKIKNGIWIENINVDSVNFQIVIYKFGETNGKTEVHYMNGNVSIGKYVNDKKNGAWKCFTNNKLTKIEYYTEGFLSRIEFFENGKVVSQAITDPTF